MKLTTFLSFIILSILIYGCSENDMLTKDFSLSNAQLIIDEYNKDKLKKDKTQIDVGSVELVSTNKELLAITTIDGKENILYFIQHNGLVPPYRKTIKNAEIIYFGNSVLINSKDELYTISLNVFDEVPKYLKEVKFNKMLKGYGLVRLLDAKLTYNSIDDFNGLESIYDIVVAPSDGTANNRNLDSPLIEGLTCGCCTASNSTSDTCLNVETDDCTAGGSGSTSCSLTTDSGASCSVTCGSSSTGSCCFEGD